MINFQPCEVVDRGSVTQPHIVENLNKLWVQAVLYFLRNINKSYYGASLVPMQF